MAERNIGNNEDWGGIDPFDDAGWMVDEVDDYDEPEIHNVENNILGEYKEEESSSEDTESTQVSEHEDEVVSRLLRVVAQQVNVISGTASHQMTYMIHSFEDDNDSTIALDTLNAWNIALEVFLTRIIEHALETSGLRRLDSSIQVYLTNGTFNVSTRVTRGTNISGGTVINTIIGVLQSFEQLDLDGLVIKVQIVRRLSVGGYAPPVLNFEQFIKTKRCVVAPPVKQGVENCVWLCIAMAVVEKHQKSGSETYRWKDYGFNRPYCPMRDDLVKSIQQQCNMENKDSVTLEEIGEIASVLGHIIIIQYPSLTVLKDYNADGTFLGMLLVNGASHEGKLHCYYIRRNKLGALWSKNRFCQACYKPYFSQNGHICKGSCGLCNKPGCKMMESGQVCDICLRYCNSTTCLRLHKARKVCKKMIACGKCGYKQLASEKTKHVCFKRMCKSCKRYVDIGVHKCFLPSLKTGKPLKKSKGYIVYDIEACLDDDNKRDHVFDLLVCCTVHVPPKKDDYIMTTFYSMKKFLEYVFQPKFQNYICIAHNAGRYDAHYIKKTLLELKIPSNDLINGMTYLRITVPKYKVVFSDSYRFIPIALRKFPKTFGIADCAKTFFPYRFYTKQKRSYQGLLPAKSWFDYDRDRPEEFDKWYASFAGKTVKLRKMCEEYCQMDVLVLAKGVFKFVSTFYDISGGLVDAFSYTTIASLCYTWYRYEYLPPKSIGIETFEARSPAFYWLKSVHPDMISMQENGWGYFTVVGPVLYMYALCSATGCNKCYQSFNRHPVTGIYMHDLEYNFNQWKIKTLRTIHVEVKYECEVRAMTIPRTVSMYNICLRDAFYGGRTETISMLYTCQEYERIHYIDVTSLYPSVQFGSTWGIRPDNNHRRRETPFPIGHPTILRGNAYTENWDQYFGFIRCDVFVPEDLFLPILPARMNGRLVFPTGYITGTWTTEEVKLAVRKGCHVAEVYEIWHYSKSSSELFKAYVQAFMKLKFKASGWKKLGCSTVDEKQALCTLLSEDLETSITIDDIGDEMNNGMYTVSKLCLNSLWGKFAQRNDRTCVRDTFTDAEFDALYFNPEYNIESVFFHDVIVRSTYYTNVVASGSLCKTTNLSIAAYTTSYARIRLYEALDAISTAPFNVGKSRVLYMDTDSVIFVQDTRYPLPVHIGSRLGEMTHELEPDEWIQEFVSTGPKSYAYKLNTGVKVCKIKGFTVRGETAKLLHFDSMKELVQGETKEISTTPFSLQLSKDHNIKVRDWSNGKVFKVTQNKRTRKQLQDNNETSLPLHCKRARN